MKFYYQIETGKHISHDELIVETDAIEYEAKDFEILCAYMKTKDQDARTAIIIYWTQAEENQRKALIEAIMERHGDEIAEAFRNRALDAAFSCVEG